MISINIAHMRSGAASAGPPARFLLTLKDNLPFSFSGAARVRACRVCVCVFSPLIGKLRSALQMPCLSSEHGGKSSGIRLPRGRVHRGAFRRRPGGCHAVVYFRWPTHGEGGEKEGVVTSFFLFVRTSVARAKRKATTVTSASSSSGGYVVVASPCSRLATRGGTTRLKRPFNVLA